MSSALSAKRRVVATLLLAMASVALTALAFEVGVRLAGFQPIFEVYSKPSLFWQRDELLGWSHQPGVSGTYVGPRPWPIEFETPIRINAVGLRGPEVGEVPEDGYRILVLGDSVVAAFEVPYEYTFVALLEERLRPLFPFPIQVINAGVRGYGTDQSYLYYRERGRKLHPDLVIFVHSLNDPRNNLTLHRMRRPFGKPAFAPGEDGALELRGHPIPVYPLCSAASLDAVYRPVRLDGPRTRMLCWLQTRLADHSALFTLLSVRLRQHPAFMRFLYRLGSPEQAALQRWPRGLLPGLAALPGVRGTQAPDEVGYALTSQLVLRLAREVWASGASFLLLLRRSEWERLDAATLEAAGVTARHLEVRADWALRFRRDGHLNTRGHLVSARLMTPVVAAQIRADRPPVGGDTP